MAFSDIATAYGIEVYSCCNNFLVGPKIKKARCVDVDRRTGTPLFLTAFNTPEEFLTANRLLKDNTA